MSRIHERARITMRWVAVAVVVTVLAHAFPTLANNAIDDPAYWRDGRQQIAAMGPGFVVWESNRNKGQWRIFIRSLEGGEVRQLSPDEKGRQHYCPHISPDGKHMVYISYPKGHTTYKRLPKKAKAPLHLIDIATGKDRVIAPAARAYFEDRAAMWRDHQHVIFIDGEGRTAEININSGKVTPLTKNGRHEYGYLLNPQKTHAVFGWAGFHEYSAKTRAVKTHKKLGGCQPYFTRDGVWGFWTGGAGGPINRFHLATRKHSTIIDKNDPRMPRQRSYLYFPMISPCQRLIAFGASPNQHDHFKSDYDIFIAPLDPDTLTLTSKPVRYTFNKANDRFPDVFLGEYTLGAHRGEAPLKVHLKLPHDKGKWEVDLGDGTSSRQPVIEHTYVKEGVYHIKATHEGKTLRGIAHVAKAMPPTVLVARVTSDREAKLIFSEKVSAARDASVKLNGEGASINVAYKLAPDGTAMTLVTEHPWPEKSKVDVTGFVDRAGHRMEPATLELTYVAWPPSMNGLTFAWQTGDQPATLLVSEGEQQNVELNKRGHARYDHHWTMLTDHGSFVAEDKVNAVLLRDLKKHNALSIEATITTFDAKQSGPARIVSFSRDSGARNFTLGQQNGDLVMRLRTPKTGNNGASPQITLCAIEPGRATHIIVTYAEGQMRCYRDGRLVMKTDKVRGNFANWEPMHLLFGDEYSGDRDWRGRLEGVALYHRVLSAEEAAHHAATYRALCQARKQPPTSKLRVKLVKASTVPDLKMIAPYRKALWVGEYSVEKVEAGDVKAHKIRVARWVILDGKIIDVPKVGWRGTIDVTRFDDNTQLQAIYRHDTLDDDFDIDIYYDAMP